MNCTRSLGIGYALLLAVSLACGSKEPRRSETASSTDSVPVVTAPARTGPATVDSASAGAHDASQRGAISIVLLSDESPGPDEFTATLLMRDAQGRRAGFDPASGQVVSEIPGATYSDEVIEDPEVEGSGAGGRGLELTGPEPGEFTLLVQGTARGTYDLSIRGYNARLEPSGREFSRIAIEPGAVHRYVLTYDASSGVVARPEQ